MRPRDHADAPRFGIGGSSDSVQPVLSCGEYAKWLAQHHAVVGGFYVYATTTVRSPRFPIRCGGLLCGVTVSGVLMAIFMSNAGGAWDNAKKSFEGGGFKMDDGTVHEKGSEAHDASVVGDTVGDPFKDTAGPSLNILVKLMSVVALVMAPLLAGGFTGLIPL